MKIKEFSITRYGPLPNSGRIMLHNFNLFYGRNEDGKTLTIDALVKLLLRRNILRDFDCIERVEENPEGYVIIEDDKGKEIKFPEKGNLTEVVGLTPSECRNIFIIRDSDLSIARESEFYTNVTDRLTGLRTEEIYSIKKKLQESGKLTRAESSADLSDSKDFGKIKSRVEGARGLIEETDSLQKKIREENLDELEKESARHRDEIEMIKQKIENLEDARKREEYEKVKASLDKLKEDLKKYEDLEIYNEDDEQLWRDSERDVEILVEEKEKLVTELKKNEREFKEISEKLSGQETGFRIFDKKKKKIDDEIRPQLKTYEIKSGELAQQETKNKFLTSAGTISAILLGISLLGTIFSPSLLFYILVVLFLILAVLSGIFKFQFVRDKSWLAGVLERNKLALSKFGLDAENIKGISSNIQKFDEEYSKKNDELQETKRGKENLKIKIRELRDEKITDIEKRTKDAGNKIGEIKRKSKEESLEEYTKKLKSKQELERSIGEHESVLKSHLEGRTRKLQENISYWDEEIESLKKYKDKAKDIKYSENAASELKQKCKRFEKKLEEIKDTMASLQKKMEDVERKANEILRIEEEYLHCRTSVDLDAIKKKLQEFITENEINKENVLKVMKIFEEIEVEEREKVSELFGKRSIMSKYFNKITDGLYEQVMFKQEAGIQVKREDGVILKVEKLSGGAYDQLYLSIRLALGEKLLKGKKGFFIMDDPFVKADPDRLQRQIQTLRKISELGWQVIYFSGKGEVRDALQGDIEEGTINHVEIQSIFS